MTPHANPVLAATSPLISISAALATKIAALAGHAPSYGDFVVAALVVSTVLVGFACCVFTACQRVRLIDLRRKLRLEVTRSRSAILLRDAVLTASREAIVIMGVDLAVPQCFGAGGALLQECLSGADAAEGARALDALLESGQPFDLLARTAAGRLVRMRGRPIGRRAVVFLDNESEAALAAPGTNAILNALPVPVWVRDEKRCLRWANDAFLELVDAASLDDARARNLFLSSSEFDLAEAALGDGAPQEARRYAMIRGTRHALSMSLAPLDDRRVVGSAVDVTAAAEAEGALNVQAAAHSSLLDQLDTGIAVFGPNGRITAYNKRCTQIWGIAPEWLNNRPILNDVLERLRELGRLPEQRNFQIWKQNLLNAFSTCDAPERLVWHLPRGESLSVTLLPNSDGGIVLLMEDVSEKLQLERARGELADIQNSILDTLDDAAAVFGPNGRLQLYNAAFLQQWRLSEADACGAPHVNTVAQTCAERIGQDGIWPLIMSGVASHDPQSYNDWSTLMRADGVVVDVEMTRLPGGATLVTLSNETDRMRLEEILRQPPPRAAA